MFPRDSNAQGATIRALLQDLTAPYRSSDHDPFDFEGPDILIDGLARNLAMAFHELITNALKYGSLSVPEGRVLVTWGRTADGSIEIDWKERFGPSVTQPTTHGLGSSLLTQLLFPPPNRVTVQYEASGVAARFLLRD